MPTMQEVREKFPQYNDMSDADLASALHKKFYADVPLAEFQQKIGFKAAEAPPERGLLGDINNFVGGVSDAITQGATLGFGDEIGAAGRAIARGITDKITGDENTPFNYSANYDRALADIRSRDKQFQEEHPVAATTANVVGGLAVGGPVSRAVTASPTLPRTIAKTAATGAGYGAVSGFGSAEGGLDSRLQAAQTGAMVGGALGGAVPLVGSTVSRVVSPVRNRLTPEAQRLAEVAKDEGIPLTAAQATGSRPLQALESVFGTLPLTSGPQQAIQQTQRNAFNRAALSRISEAGDSVTPEVLDAASKRIGGDFKKLSAQTTVKLDEPFVRDVTDVVAKYNDRLEVQKRPIFENFVKEILGDGTRLDPMKGAVYQTARSDLSRMAKGYGGTDPTLAAALRGLRDALDDAAERSMPDQLKGDWKEARRQWANLRTLEKASANTTTQTAAGNLQPTQLAQAVRQQHPRAYGFGAGEMNDLSRVGNTFVRDQVPNSGTPERTALMSLMTGGGGAGLAIGDPLVAGAAVAAPLLGPRAVQMAYNAPLVQRYLKNQVGANAAPQINQGLLAAVLAGTAGRGLLDQ